ncbi:MAG: phenylalanine--tRNA ligase subunit beta [Clostridia bacterium]|nr:phenylalanine--tRNA ligase subunit beta [Clostridia bacterium]
MKLSLQWLSEYVALDGITPAELADKLVNIGFEVEEIVYTGKGIERVVTGKILDIKKHPDADKLRVCMVDVGTEITTIVTGAQNVQTGDFVPVALDGALLPNGKTINAAPLRGVMSYGMLCSGAELGIDNNVIKGAEENGILILPETEIGKDIRELLRLNDWILDVSVTANRPDCQSVYGMAREVAAVLGRKRKPLSLKYKTVPCDCTPTVKISNTACTRYTCRVIKDVKIQQSPQWMRDRLRSVGVRPINNVVDITNYVLFEVGQPLHAFDTSYVSDLGIIVRSAQAGEKITTLDSHTYTLTNEMLVIADKEKALAVAGVMGGEYSGINEQTQSVLLESAGFAKGSVRATSRALGLRSDSSARYEKGVDAMSVDMGRERALALFDQLKAGKVTDAFAEEIRVPTQTKTIKTSAKKICDLLGIEIKQSVIAKILKALDFVVQTDGDSLNVDVPAFREDIDNYTDLAEEVIRYYGYDNLQSTFLPTAKTTAGGEDIRLKNLNLVKACACGVGAYEINTFSFYGKKAADKLNLPSDSELRNQIEILNPLGEEYSLMRTQLVSNMLNVAALNISRKNTCFRLFEVGKTYFPKALPLTELPDERDTLCLAFAGESESFYTIKAAALDILGKFAIKPERIEYTNKPYLHPGIGCDFFNAEDAIVCSLGKLHPAVAKNYGISIPVYICEIYLHTFIQKEIPLVRFEPLPKYQEVDRDLAVVVRMDIPVGAILKSVRAADTLCVRADLFDIYTGEQIDKGYKSVALSLGLSAPDRTLNDKDITTAMQKILSALEEQFDAKLRL